MNTTSRKRSGSILMLIGGIMLLVDLLIWAGVYVLPALGMGATAIATLAIMLVFLFGLPLIFIGVLFLLIGLAIRVLAAQSQAFILMVISVITLVIGILAFVVPAMFVEPGSGDTLLAWMVGLTALFVGVPLFLIGGILFLVGLIMAVKRYISSYTHRDFRQAPR